MPAYLVGGDYVRTFNDDKLSDELAITLQIGCPATIYILLDDRARAPEWLVNEFEHTTEKIGLDRGIGRVRAPGSDDSPQWTRRPTGIGAGVSVDETFSIWKRTIHQAGEVVLGPLSGHDWDTNMYGIVAVPLADRVRVTRDVSEMKHRCTLSHQFATAAPADCVVGMLLIML